MNRLYEKLKDNENFKGKLKFDESKNCLMIVFHEYLWLEYFEGDYTACWDEGLINLCGSFKDFTAHWHIQSDDEALKAVIDFTNEDAICIEDTNSNFLSFSSLRIMKKEKFERKKEKYMAKKSLRIYSTGAIIKRNGY